MNHDWARPAGADRHMKRGVPDMCLAPLSEVLITACSTGTSETRNSPTGKGTRGTDVQPVQKS